MTEIIGLITARGGSKGIPGKNILPVAGKPLIAWTIEAALEAPSIERVVVSTDSQEIADVAQKYGAEVPFLRPPELATDSASHMAVMVHAVQWLERSQETRPDYFMLLQPTSPLRTSDDIEAAVQIAVEQDADAVISVSETRAHPYQVRRIESDGNLREFISFSPPPGTSETRRQEFPTAYRVNGAIYLTKRNVILEQRTLEPSNTLPYIMPEQRSLEVDEPWDYYLINLILEDHNRASRSGDQKAMADQEPVQLRL